VRVLEPLGFLTRVVTNGEEVLEEFERWHPHLVLMDMRMPVMDGYEATRRIRMTPAGADAAIIGVSASAFAEMRQGVFDAGVDDFITKPFHEAELLGKIGDLLGVHYVYEESTTVEALRRDAALGPDAPSSLTVLYVEDDQSNVALIERVLARRPHVSLLVARSGTAGLDLARRHQLDLIFIDLHLPDVSGDDLLIQLRQDPRASTTPIFVISGDPRPGTHQRLLEEGASGFLTKPIDIDETLRLIDAMSAGPDRPVVADTPESHRYAGRSASDATWPADSPGKLALFVHDLNNHLGVIRSYATLLAVALTDPGLASQLAALRAATERAIELTRGLADGHPSELFPRDPPEM